MDIGDTGIKIAGRESGQICAVVDKIDENFVMVVGPRVRRRRCNVAHIKPLPKKLSLKKGASDAEVIDALIKLGLIRKEDVPAKKPKKEKKEQVKAPRKSEKPEKKKVIPKLSLKKKKQEKTPKKEAKK